MITVYKEVEIDIDLDDFDDDDLIEELDSRGNGGVGHETRLCVNAIYEKRRLGQDYQRELDTLIYTVLGKSL